MDSFKTLSQYDKKFKDLGNFGNDRSACTFFALITASKFMDNNNMSEEQHIENVESCVTKYIESGINDNLSFDALLTYTDIYTGKDVEVTSCELLENNIIGYEHIFSNNENPYCVIFLKNTNYFVVMVRDGIYSVRNCHETEQYNFWTLEDLTEHLNNKYHFNKEVDLDGYKIPEFSNIEFLIVNKKLTIPIKNNTEDDEKFALELQEFEYKN